MKPNTLQVDKNAPVPSAVARNAADIDKYYSEMEEAKKPKAPEGEGENKGEQNQNTQERNTQEQNTQTQNREENKTETPPKQQSASPDTGSWEHKYNSMKGRHDQLAVANRDMSDRVLNMERLVATLQANGTAPRTEQTTAPKVLITAEDRETYGEDLTDFVTRAAQQGATATEQKLLDRITQLEQRITGVAATTAVDATQRVYQALDKEVPDWRDQNINPEFISWLALPDPFSGDIRSDLLNRAFSRHDTPRVLNFFKGFLSEKAAVDPGSRQEPENKAAVPTNSNQENGNGTNPQKIPLETFAAPGRARGSAAAAPDDKPYLTNAEIAAFYSDVRAGKYRGREEEQKRREAYIWEAQSAGRITA